MVIYMTRQPRARFCIYERYLRAHPRGVRGPALVTVRASDRETENSEGYENVIAPIENGNWRMSCEGPRWSVG